MVDDEICIESILEQKGDDLAFETTGLRQRYDTKHKHRKIYTFSSHPTNEDEVLQKLKLLGYSLIVGSWFICILSLGFVFNLWQWCFSFNSKNINSSERYELVTILLEMIQEQNKTIENYYVFAFFLTFVVLWIWAVASWISMKLFRHSKGGGS